MKMDVLMVIEGEIATTQLIERILEACGKYGLTYRKQYLSSLKVEDFRTYTIPFFVRCGDPLLEFWINRLRFAKHPYLYYIDDNFWRIGGDSQLARYYQHPTIRKSLEFAITNATAVLTNSNELALFLRRFSSQICELPTFFDFSLIDQVIPDETDEVRIGFAGSPSRMDDLEIVRPLIGPVLLKFPNVVFEFAGILPRDIKPSDRVRLFPYNNQYNEFIQFQAKRNWAIGLAPLIDNESNRCKTNNKYREYSACKIVGIYSDIPPYQSSVIHDVTGLLVKNTPESWFKAISELVASPDKRIKLMQRSNVDVQKRYCVERVSEVWARNIEIINNHLHTHPPRPLRKLLKGSRLSLRMMSLHMKVLLSYQEGGFPLILHRSIRRILRINKKQ